MRFYTLGQNLFHQRFEEKTAFQRIRRLLETCKNTKNAMYKRFAVRPFVLPICLGTIKNRSEN